LMMASRASCILALRSCGGDGAFESGLGRWTDKGL